MSSSLYGGISIKIRKLGTEERTLLREGTKPGLLYKGNWELKTHPRPYERRRLRGHFLNLTCDGGAFLLYIERGFDGSRSFLDTRR